MEKAAAREDARGRPGGRRAAGVRASGCDGIVCATPTGSTAYAFSAGGPVVWPEVEALLMVPISAHALFARPLVTSPDSVLAVEVLPHIPARGCCGATGGGRCELPPGARVEVRRGERAGAARAAAPRRRSPTGWWRSSRCRCAGWRGALTALGRSASSTSAEPLDRAVPDVRRTAWRDGHRPRRSCRAGGDADTRRSASSTTPSSSCRPASPP